MPERVTFEEMRRRTKVHPEERYLHAFGNIDYSDFFDFYKGQFPNAYPLPRVRISDRVNAFIQSTRPKPFELSFDDFQATLGFNQEGLTLKRSKTVLEISDGVAAIDLATGKSIRVYSRAEIDAEVREVMFIPKIADWMSQQNCTRSFLSDILERVGFCEFGLGFPHTIRIEHLVGYNGYPSNNGHFDQKGRPFWVLDKVPIARVSYTAEPESTDEHWVKQKA